VSTVEVRPTSEKAASAVEVGEPHEKVKNLTKVVSASERTRGLVEVGRELEKVVNLIKLKLESEKAVATSIAEVRLGLPTSPKDELVDQRSINEPESTSSMDANIDELPDLGEDSNLLESVKDDTEEPVGLGDINITEGPLVSAELEDHPVLQIEQIFDQSNAIFQIVSDNTFEIKTMSKPQGSAHVTLHMSIGFRDYTPVPVCLDTGADITICSYSFLEKYFGKEKISQKIVKLPSKEEPKLRSASGHSIKVYGQIKAFFKIGSYTFNYPVVVFEAKNPVFLMGSDCFYNRFILIVENIWHLL